MTRPGNPLSMMKAVIRNRPLTEAWQAPQAKSETSNAENRITLSLQLSASLRHLEEHITLLPEPDACCMLFFTVAAEDREPGVFFVRRATLEAAWREGSTRVRQWAWARQLSAVELRIDWPNEVMGIESQIPPLCQQGLAAASAWALADDNLEYAELIPMAGLPGIRQSLLDKQPQKCGAAHDAPAHWLLRLQGLQVGSNGVQTQLPRAPMPQPGSPRPITQWQPYLPAVKLLSQQQQREGNWLDAVDCEHLGMTYALLLAQCEATDAEPAHAMLIQAMDRAIGYLEKNLDTLIRRAVSVHIEQAMCLLVFSGHLSSRHGCHAFPELLGRMQRLAGDLHSLWNAAALCAKPLISLALNALAERHATYATGLPNALKAKTADAPSSAPLLDAFLTALSQSHSNVTIFISMVLTISAGRPAKLIKT